MESAATGNGAARSVDPADVEQLVLKWLRTELEDPDVVGSDNFLDIGGHSLMFASLNKVLADSFGVVIDRKVTYDEPLSVAVASMAPIDSTAPASR